MLNDKHLPTTTATPWRTQIFQPTKTPKMLTDALVETAWGKCKVTGRLGQPQACLWESIFYCTEKSRVAGERLEVIVDPARIRAKLSERGYSGEGLEKLFTDLAAAFVEVKTAGWPAVGHLIDTHEKSSEFSKINHLTGKERLMIRVKVGDAGMALLKNDVKLWRDPALVASLRYGVSQAVARLVLSHQGSGRMKIDTALTVVGIPKSGDARRKARARLIKDANGLLKAGVVVSDGFVFTEPCYRDKSVPRTPDSVPRTPDSVPRTPGVLDSLGLLESLENHQNQSNSIF